jgi:hypothetical protein
MNNLALKTFPSKREPRILNYPISFKTEDGSILDKYEENARTIKVVIDSTTYSEYISFISVIEKIISAIPSSNQYHNLNVRTIKGEYSEGKIVYRIDPRLSMRVLSSVNINSKPRTTILQTDVLLNIIKKIAKEDGLDVDLLFNTVSKFIAIDGDTIYVLEPVLPEN